jgi:hypothetical protein
VNPAIAVTPGARVSIQVINAGPDTAPGLVVTASTATSSWMPMMTARPAFPGSAVWFLGNPTTAGMHAGTLTFTASTPGSYRYLCPVPRHAQKGMTGTFTVTPADALKSRPGRGVPSGTDQRQTALEPLRHQDHGPGVDRVSASVRCVQLGRVYTDTPPMLIPAPGVAWLLALYPHLVPG